MFKVRVPCSSANVGPGFDCLAIAFDIYNEFTFEKSDTVCFEGFQERYCNENNLVLKAYRWTLEKIGRPFVPIKIGFNGNVPTARGLGSSSTCIVAGVAAAFEISGVKRAKNEVAYLSGVFEGHFDNVSACVFGGFVSSLATDNDLFVRNYPVSKKFGYIVLIPDFELSTKLSREAVPKMVSLANAKKNIANAVSLVKAFEMGDGALLKVASNDNLHQPYRGELINGYFDLYNQCLENGANAVFLSGAGPSMLVVCSNTMMNKMEAFVKSKTSRWEVKQIKIDFSGLTITRK